MCPAVDLERTPAHQSNVSLVDQRCRLQGVTWALPAQLTVRQRAKLVINQRHQRFEGLLITSLPPRKELSYRLTGCLGH
jgi:hypothetical protein